MSSCLEILDCGDDQPDPATNSAAQSKQTGDTGGRLDWGHLVLRQLPLWRSENDVQQHPQD